MASPEFGLKSDALRAALKDALSGRSAKLRELLSRHGAMPSASPNLKLAAAFGAEVAQLEGRVATLLQELGSDDAAPDTAQVFLPIAAAHGWAACVRAEREVEPAWAALAELAADERKPVRLGTLSALLTIGLRERGADVLVTRALHWLDTETLELRFGAAAGMLDVLADGSVLATLGDQQLLLDYLGRVIEEITEAKRAADRSEGRRRILLGLPRIFAAVIAGLRSEERGLHWFEGECTRATHPDIRETLSDAIALLRRGARAQPQSVVDTLRAALAASAKPARDAARVRPGTGSGRGKRSRRIR